MMLPLHPLNNIITETAPGNLRLYVLVIIRNIMVTSISLYALHLRTNIFIIYRIMKKILGLLIIVMGLIQVTIAQDSDVKGFDKSKLFVGGGLGLAFGTYTIVNVTPLVGYRFSELFAAGVGINYSYYGYNDGYWNYKQSYAGMSIFGRVYPV